MASSVRMGLLLLAGVAGGVVPVLDAPVAGDSLLRERAFAENAAEHQPRLREGAVILGDRVEARFEHGVAHLPAGIAIRLSTLGREHSAVSFDAAAEAEVVGAEVRLQRAAGVTEWWRSLPSGLEHGVTLAEAISGSGALVLTMAVGAGIRVEAVSDHAVRLVDASSGAPLASYDHLVVLDAEGSRVRARLAAASDGIRIRVDDRGAVYPLVIDPLITAHEAMLMAPDRMASDRFGAALAISANGARALVGVAGDDTSAGNNAGTARVLGRTGGVWAQDAVLESPSPAAVARFGASVSLSADGTRALVGAPSAVVGGAYVGRSFVFRNDGAGWVHEATLEAADGEEGDELGGAVALSGDGTRAMVAAPNRGLRFDPYVAPTGRVLVFVRSGKGWTREATLGASQLPGAYFGRVVALSFDGARALVAATGSATVLARAASTWTQEAVLVHPDADPNDGLGFAAALSADGLFALVSTDHDDVGAITNAGSAHVFAFGAGTWTHQATLLAPMLDYNDYFGGAVSLSGDGSRALVGLDYEDIGVATEAGSAELFVRTGSAWAHDATLLPPTAQASAYFGSSLALAADGSRAIVGASYADVPGAVDGGAAHVFRIGSNGTPCSTAVDCASGFCADGVCCDEACGGSAVDCEACSAPLTGGVAGTCAPLAPSVAATITCRALVGGTCDAAAETCVSTSRVCPLDGAAPVGTPCRPSAGDCDAEERCDGTSLACPADVRVPAGIVCRAPAGPCDAAEACTGAGVDCPVDGFLNAATVCRPSIGSCDVEDRCAGSSAECPEVRVAAGTMCRASSGEVCDAPDVCDGSSPSCVDAFLSGVECRASRGSCDPAEVCAGSAAACPPDQLEPAGMVCRASSDPVCDPDESCDGVAASCPADGTTCVVLDAGVATDAANGDAGPPTAATGCSCRAGSSGSPPFAALALGLMLTAVLRRRS